ncbi:MAG: secretin N-terminal domain-containing protein, partial [Mailhella sp.]
MNSKPARPLMPVNFTARAGHAAGALAATIGNSMRILILSCIIACSALLLSCAEKPPRQTSSYDWNAEAETRQGYSPSTSDLHPEPRVLMQHTEPSASGTERPLPKTPVTLKLHGVDVGVALRSLSAAANISIMLSPGVAGTVSLNVAKQPWRDVFCSILSSNGLEYRWQGHILQILTAAEKQKEINLLTLDNQLQEQRSQARHVGPISLSIVSVRYSEAKELKESITRLAGQQKDTVIDVDKHTNALIIQCPSGDRERLLALIEHLDRPRPQVQLKAYIVETT